MAKVPKKVKATTASSGKKKPKKRTLVLAAVGGMLVIACAVSTALILRYTSPKYAANEDSAKTTKTAAKLDVAVTVVDGTVLYQHGAFDMMAPTSDTTLAEGDSVKANEASRAVLTFDDGSALRLDANTTVTVSEFGKSGHSRHCRERGRTVL